MSQTICRSLVNNPPGPEQNIPKWKRGLAHAFAVEGEKEALSESDRAILERVAEQIVRRRMATPAVLFLESLRPLNFIGSQVLTFLQPFLTLVFSDSDVKNLAAALEKRSSISYLLDRMDTPPPCPKS